MSQNSPEFILFVLLRQLNCRSNRYPPLIAMTKWTSLDSSSRSRIFKCEMVPFTNTEMFGRTLSSSHNRSLIPGYSASRFSIASRTLEPATVTEAFPCVRSRSGVGIQRVGMRLYTPTLPSPISKSGNGGGVSQSWNVIAVRINIFYSPSPIRDRRMGEGRDGGQLFFPCVRLRRGWESRGWAWTYLFTILVSSSFDPFLVFWLFVLSGYPRLRLIQTQGYWSRHCSKSGVLDSLSIQRKRCALHRTQGGPAPNVDCHPVRR